jgi:hypothetical protein
MQRDINLNKVYNVWMTIKRKKVLIIFSHFHIYFFLLFPFISQQIQYINKYRLKREFQESFSLSLLLIYILCLLFWKISRLIRELLIATCLKRLF